MYVVAILPVPLLVCLNVSCILTSLDFQQTYRMTAARAALDIVHASKTFVLKF